MAENKDKVKLEDTFSADEAAVKTTSENKEEKASHLHPGPDFVPAAAVPCLLLGAHQGLLPPPG